MTRIGMTPDAPASRIEPIDPDADHLVKDVRVPIPDLGGIDLRQVVFNYDRDSDILLFYPYGKDRPAVAAGGSDYVYVLIDADSAEFVGVQIEDFLSRAVKAQPNLLDVLDVAELQGMTLDDVRQARQQALGYRGRFLAWLTHLRQEALGRQTGAKQRAVSEIINGPHRRLADGPSPSVI